jgi:hypothetical protein
MFGGHGSGFSVPWFGANIRRQGSGQGSTVGRPAWRAVALTPAKSGAESCAGAGRPDRPRTSPDRPRRPRPDQLLLRARIESFNGLMNAYMTGSPPLAGSAMLQRLCLVCGPLGIELIRCGGGCAVRRHLASQYQAKPTCEIDPGLSGPRIPRRATGSRRPRARAGSRSCASIARSNRSSTRVAAERNRSRADKPMIEIPANWRGNGHPYVFV